MKRRAMYLRVADSENPITLLISFRLGITKQKFQKRRGLDTILKKEKLKQEISGPLILDTPTDFLSSIKIKPQNQISYSALTCKGSENDFIVKYKQLIMHRNRGFLSC